MCVSLLVPVCHVCVCLCVISNKSTSKNNVIRVKLTVNLMPCCIRCIKVLLVPRYKGSTSLDLLYY